MVPALNNFPLVEAESNYPFFAGLGGASLGGEGSELNSPGFNEPLWPVLINAFVPLKPLILLPDMLDTFDRPPDLIIGAENNTIIMPREVRDQSIRSNL